MLMVSLLLQMTSLDVDAVASVVVLESFHLSLTFYDLGFLDYFFYISII